MKVINIPRNLTPQVLTPFSIDLNSNLTGSEREFCFDFAGLGLVEPFGMLFLSAIIRRFIREGRLRFGDEFRLSAMNFKGKSYASWMALFKSCGLDYGNEPGQASGSSTYIPITRLVVARIKSEAREGFVHHGEVIERESSRIADVLTRGSGCSLNETLTYAIREIMRNVVEHGEASHIWYAAQYWPTKARVEVAVLDEGVGLLQSLKRNDKLNIANNNEAIFRALQPGVSGVPKKKRKSSDGAWVNSGYGLYMTSSLCNRGGDFFIVSDDLSLSLCGGEVAFHDCSYKGVAIRIVLDTNKIGDLRGTLEEIRSEGERIAAEIGNPSVELTASKMSRMLSRQ